MSVAILHNSHFKSFLKFVGALSIPIGIGWFFMYSQEQANIEVANYKAEQKANPTADSVVVDNYQLKEVDDMNHIKWQLSSEKGRLAPNNKDVILDKVKVEYFDGPNVKMRIYAPKGTANQETRYVKLMSENKVRVQCEGDGGKSKFEAETVELTKKNQFLATGGVIIEWSEVAKVTGLSATGTIGKGGIDNVKVKGNTHAIITCK
ncbi:MAG: LPS export ABC transporter periplasmic protein LptC [Candidatus Obscuribacterales bacterium]|nr:LPS export ABC transporter periplasmic protein LptC [Candidatus Obscuribacterales bacterium]